jgi:hypothetical protein
MVKKTSKTVSKRTAGRGARARSRARKPPAARRPEPIAVEAPIVEPAPEPAAAVEAVAPPAEIALSIPEPGFAVRALPAEPERPLPTARRAVFFDVENASRPEHIARVIEHLAVDRMGQRTDFVAVGNWRVIGHDTARLLARHGAQLVHSAPSVGVRDWSDLRIAVAAGVWLAGARPGDIMEIVTSDRAFDAVGDVAASLGIAFRRLSHQGIAGTFAETVAPVREPVAEPRSRRRGRGRRRGWGEGAPRHGAAPAHAAPRTHPPAAAHEPALRLAPGPLAEPHTAPHDEIIAVVHDLMQRAPGRAVTLDTLANELKARGFSRPPGSPRLITRLRRIKEIELSRSGVITLVGGEAEPAVPEPAAESAVQPEEAGADLGPEPGNEALAAAAAPESTPSARRRRSRRGGRGRRRPKGAPA